MYAILQELLSPFTILYLLTVVVLCELWVKRRLNRVRLLLLTLLVLAFGLFATPVVAHLAVGSLEWRYPPCDAIPEGTQAIVVLAGDVLFPDGVRNKAELGTSTLHRCLKAATLYRESGPHPIVLSGGHIPSDSESALAEVMRSFMLSQGIPASNLIVEDSSTTTFENSVEVARLLSDREVREIVLVTDAVHLRRAEACFTAQGLHVTPCGCSYRATRFQWTPQSFIPSPAAASAVDAAAHEWLGLLWYRISGRI